MNDTHRGMTRSHVMACCNSNIPGMPCGILYNLFNKVDKSHLWFIFPRFKHLENAYVRLSSFSRVHSTAPVALLVFSNSPTQHCNVSPTCHTGRRISPLSHFNDINNQKVPMFALLTFRARSLSKTGSLKSAIYYLWYPASIPCSCVGHFPRRRLHLATWRRWLAYAP